MTTKARGRKPAADPGLGLLRQMLRIRRFEEECVERYSAGEIRGFMHVYIGEEAVAAGVCAALEPDDAVVSTYREHGHALARGVPMDAVMAEMFGRTTGCSHGRGGSMHLFDVRHGFYGGNAIVGGGLPPAIGIALAAKLRGERRVVVCFFGEGAVAEGEFHEALNLAALWRLPVLFACENNRYAMGTALDRSHAATDIALRAASYGLVAFSVDGMDARRVAEAAERAVRGIRDGAGPHLLELRTYRFRAHSMYDPDRYRPKEEVREERTHHDPIDVLTGALYAEKRLTDDDLALLEKEVAAEVTAAVEAARQAPVEPVEDLTRHVYAEESDAGRRP